MGIFFPGVLQYLLKKRISESCVIFCGLGYMWLDMENLSCILRTVEWFAQPPYVVFKRY